MSLILVSFFFNLLSLFQCLFIFIGFSFQCNIDVPHFSFVGGLSVLSFTFILILLSVTCMLPILFYYWWNNYILFHYIYTFFRFNGICFFFLSLFIMIILSLHYFRYPTFISGSNFVLTLTYLLLFHCVYIFSFSSKGSGVISLPIIIILSPHYLGLFYGKGKKETIIYSITITFLSTHYHFISYLIFHPFSLFYNILSLRFVGLYLLGADTREKQNFVVLSPL